MTYRAILSRLTLAAPAALFMLPGCSNDADHPDARTAEQAVGVEPRRDTTRTVESTKDVTVVKDTKVIDNTTGHVISETKESTPVKITEQKRLTTDVKVDVGKSTATQK